MTSDDLTANEERSISITTSTSTTTAITHISPCPSHIRPTTRAVCSASTSPTLKSVPKHAQSEHTFPAVSYVTIIGLQSPLPLTSFPDLLLIQYKRPSFLRQRHPIPTSVRSQCLVILPHYHWAKIPAVRTLIFHPIRRRYSLIPCQTSSRCAI